MIHWRNMIQSGSCFPVLFPRFASMMMLTARLVSLVACGVLLAGCDTAKLEYATKAEAAKDEPFARGWLPKIVPDSSREITMENDLDLNLSEGAFAFDAADHDEFVSKLVRIPDRDDAHAKAYEYDEWVFWIDDSQDRCRFRFRLAR